MPRRKRIGIVIVTNDKLTNEMIVRYLSQQGIGEEAIVKLPEEAGGELGFEVREDFLESMLRAAENDRRIVFKPFELFADGGAMPFLLQRPRDSHDRKALEKVRKNLGDLIKRRNKLLGRKSTRRR
ncbi:MAG TPA: hypothetical protein PKA31_01450 [Candidatus Moranbacteria bacterium]|nr:hypothetical protein [Candidatus Moranbacteria bacterium]